jgi:FMN phosphatase YigB (HAD superfamily)
MKIKAVLHVKPGECLMVGDWPEKDMIGAKAAGMLTCWAKYGSRFKDGEADFILRDIKEIFKVLQAC